MASTKPVHAVHDDDLELYLKNLALLGDLRAGRLQCKFCKDPITLESLHALFPESGTIKVVCSKIECQKDLMRLLNER